jgi:hypothetical protein
MMQMNQSMNAEYQNAMVQHQHMMAMQQMEWQRSQEEMKAH